MGSDNVLESGMVRSRGDIDRASAAHWLALLAVFSQIVLGALCECGLPPRDGEVFGDAASHAHHGGNGASDDECNACRVTCGSSALVAALFILLALALIPLRRERIQPAPIWVQNYSGDVFDGRAPPLSV